jgi:hypothetical protein
VASPGHAGGDFLVTREKSEELAVTGRLEPRAFHLGDIEVVVHHETGPQGRQHQEDSSDEDDHESRGTRHRDISAHGLSTDPDH